MTGTFEDMKEVIIIGGGLVGGLTALLLADGGVQATVLDAAPILDEASVLQVANPRVLALSQATIHLLQAVNVWSKIQRQMPYTCMQVWNKNGYGEINFGEESPQYPNVENSLGSMVEPSVLNLAIQQQMLAAVKDYRTQVKVVRIERGVKCWIVKLADGTKLKTKLLIGADGANSFVREQAYIDFVKTMFQDNEAFRKVAGKFLENRPSVKPSELPIETWLKIFRD